MALANPRLRSSTTRHWSPPALVPWPAEGHGCPAAYSRSKRVVDVVLGLVLLVLLALPMLLIALAVALTSPGPVLFRQVRGGLGGQTFTILKFRTMRDGDHSTCTQAAAREIGAKDPADPRITAIGRLLRRSSLDELPQIFNVLRGEMTLVGPRPHHLADMARYSDYDRQRLAVKPGMTGLWQVSGRSDNGWSSSVELDLTYIRTWSPALDLAILARTPAVVLRGRGAY